MVGFPVLREGANHTQPQSENKHRYELRRAARCGYT